MDSSVFILWGFLGSGKTTLIHYLLATCLAGKKVVVIENESGAAPIDGAWLRSRNYRVIDLKSGCICCTLRMELPRVVAEIRRTAQPEIILIEPSGLASLEELIRIPGCPVDGVIALVDVPRYRWFMRLNAAFYRRQFGLSAVVFLTKAEEVEPAERVAVQTELLALSPAMQLVADYRSLEPAAWASIWKNCRNFASASDAPVLSKPETSRYRKQTLSVQAPLDISFYTDWFNRINHLFQNPVVRLKGLVADSKRQWYKLDSVGETISVRALPAHDEFTKLPAYGCLSVYGEKTAGDVRVDWLSAFVNGVEVACSVDQLTLEAGELYRYLGFHSSLPDDYTAGFIHRLKQEALAVCRPRFGYRLLSGGPQDKQALVAGGRRFVAEAIIIHALKQSEFYAAIVATVGQELEEWIRQKRAGEDVMEAFIADALGSLIVEAVVAWGVSFLESKMKALHFHITNSYSPGYCGWDVAEQHLFFSLLPGRFCGITLTGSSLMLPVKSVSALVGIGKEVEKKPYGCAICRKKDCFKRKEVHVS